MTDKPTLKDVRRDLLAPDGFIVAGERIVAGIVRNWRPVLALMVLLLIVAGVHSLWRRHVEGKELEAAGALFAAEKALPGSDPAELLRRLQAGEEATEDVDPAKLGAAAQALVAVADAHSGTLQADFARVEAAAAWFRAGDLAKAAEQYALARNSDSELVRQLAIQGEGEALLALKEYDRAAAAFQALRGEAPGRIGEQAWIDHARALEAAGKRDEAARVLEEFQVEHPDSALKSSAQARLAGLKSGGGGSAAAPAVPPAPPAAAPAETAPPDAGGAATPAPAGGQG